MHDEDKTFSGSLVLDLKTRTHSILSVVSKWTNEGHVYTWCNCLFTQLPRAKNSHKGIFNQRKLSSQSRIHIYLEDLSKIFWNGEENNK